MLKVKLEAKMKNVNYIRNVMFLHILDSFFRQQKIEYLLLSNQGISLKKTFFPSGYFFSKYFFSHYSSFISPL